MNPPGAGTAGTDVLRSQVEALGETMKVGFDEIKGLIRGLDERVRQIERNEAGCTPVMQSKIDAAWRKIDELDAKINEQARTTAERLQRLTKLEQQMATLQGILAFLGTTTGAMVLGLLYAVLTHQVQLGP
jgi:chromosome segregation ATPase